MSGLCKVEMSALVARPEVGYPPEDGMGPLGSVAWERASARLRGIFAAFSSLVILTDISEVSRKSCSVPGEIPLA
jgi:hypothetical protein